MKSKKEQQAYIEGMEDGIEWIRKDMGGGALRMFDIHSYQILDYIKQVKDKLK